MSPRHAPPDAVVISLPDLLYLTGCADLDGLSNLIDGDADADLEVLEEVGGLGVSSSGGAIVLPYPFALTDFWAVVAEVEQDEVRRWEEQERNREAGVDEAW